MNFNDTAGKSIKTNKIRDQMMFRQISFCFGPILNTAFSFPKEFFHPNKGSLSTESAHSVHLLTTSAAKDGGSWVYFAGLKQQINITTAKAGASFVGSPDRAPAVPNPKNASFAAIVSTEILPMILNETADTIIKNDVPSVQHDHQMFCSNSFFLHQTRRTSCTAYIVMLNTVFLSHPQRSFRSNEGFLSSVPTLASAQGSLDDEMFWCSGFQKRSRRGRVFRDISMCTPTDSLKKEREDMEVLSFTDESRKGIRANFRRHSDPPVIHANVVLQSTTEVIFPTCTWESVIDVSF
jgi:hypothetical protein